MAADPLTKSTVDDLFNYDVDSDDPFGENTITAQPRDDKPTLSPRAAKRRPDADDGDLFGLDLGLDQEVKIKKRKPNPKLDETLLLSKSGIPKLRAIARDGVSKKLRLKGKGHEFTDAAKLLNFFQLWLDDLYPRAKFADGLQMVEKVGHTKRMQVMRREWINESKHKGMFDEDMYGGQDTATAAEMPKQDGNNITKEGENTRAAKEPDLNDLFFPDANDKPPVKHRDEPDEDELDALLAEHEATPQRKPQQPATISVNEDDEDLDALLAEHETRMEDNLAPKELAVDHDDEDLDALMAE